MTAPSATLAIPTMPFVFVTVGTDHHPFDRVVRAVDHWASRRTDVACIMQIGSSAPPRHAQWADLVPFSRMLELLSHARAVVCHGGPATIMDVRAAGILPIVMPRTADRGEHVDDHQVRFTRRMAELGQVRLAPSAEVLTGELDDAMSSPGTLRLTETNHDVAVAVDMFTNLVDGLLATPRARMLRRGAGGRVPTGADT